MRKREKMSALVTANEVRSRIITLRNQPVLIDADVAELYGVQKKKLLQRTGDLLAEVVGHNTLLP